MIRQLWKCSILYAVGGLLFFVTSPVYAVPAKDASPDLCTVRYQLNNLGKCPLEGPGGNAETNQRRELPDDLPLLKTLSPNTRQPLANKFYARVVMPNAPIYSKLEDVAANVIKRQSGRGFIFVSYDFPLTYNGEEFFRINPGEFIRRSDLSLLSPSEFQGMALAQQPERPFGWVLFATQPRLTPAGKVNPTAPTYKRYDVIQVFDKQRIGDTDWFLVARNQWIDQRFLGLVEVQPMPPQVIGKWIAVNLHQQTLAVYEHERLIYATLISSGVSVWNTRPGLFQVFEKLEWTPMSGAFSVDKSDYYSLEDVPWTMYFDGAIALHGTYWHNGFGFEQSHGCVNLSPKDAFWLFKWAEVGTVVYVYDPTGRTPTTSLGGGP